MKRSLYVYMLLLGLYACGGGGHVDNGNRYDPPEGDDATAPVGLAATEFTLEDYKFEVSLEDAWKLDVTQSSENFKVFSDSQARTLQYQIVPSLCSSNLLSTNPYYVEVYKCTNTQMHLFIENQIIVSVDHDLTEADILMILSSFRFLGSE